MVEPPAHPVPAGLHRPGCRRRPGLGSHATGDAWRNRPRSFGLRSSPPRTEFWFWMPRERSSPTMRSSPSSGACPSRILSRVTTASCCRFVLPQLKDPEAFLGRLRSLYEDSKARCDDLVEFLDGRVFERHSEPQRAWGRNIGRVWGFRDITERRRAEKALAGKRRTLSPAVPTQFGGVYRANLAGRFWTVMKPVRAFSVFPTPQRIAGAERRRTLSPTRLADRDLSPASRNAARCQILNTA